MTAVQAPSILSTFQLRGVKRGGDAHAGLLRILPGSVAKVQQENLGKTVFVAMSWLISGK